MATKEAQTLLEKKRKEFQNGFVQNKGTKTGRNSYPARRAKLLTSCKEKMMEDGNTGAKHTADRHCRMFQRSLGVYTPS